MAKTQTAKWGNSLAVRIPKDVAEQVCLKEGDDIEIKAARGKIEVHPIERILTLEELVAQITPENRHGETGRAGRYRMVKRYILRAGDIAWLDFDPQAA